ncbi:MAG: glycosyltransferase family 39 protein, partial [Acidobacteriota bacterium]
MSLLQNAAVPSTAKPTDRRAFLFVAILAAAHIAFSLWGNEPGYLTYDSGTYHFMVKTFAETGGFVVDNGYELAPSDELIVAQLRAPREVLVAQYPEVYTFIALPFYLLMGYPGLLFLNALAFVAIVLMIYRLAMRLFGEPGLAITAMAIYAFATYAWEWSHSSYPHLTSTLLVLVAADAIAGLLFDDDSARGWGPALVAGLLVGLGAGLRLDSIFVLPALALPLLLASPVRWRALGALGAGLVPGL